MPVTIRSFAKINLGLCIGPSRPDGFHALNTVYQTIALHDVIHLQVKAGAGIEIRCDDPRVPGDESNTCYRTVERAMAALKGKGRVIIEIEKHLPVQGGLGGASGNAVAALLALEPALTKRLSGEERLRIAAEVGSDLPLFLIGGTVLGVGRGEEVYPLPDLPSVPCVVALPEIAVATPKAFADWDRLCGAGALARETGTAEDGRPHAAKLTLSSPSDRMTEFSRRISGWLGAVSGVPVGKARGRAGNPLLDLVRTGIENDFEQVVFPQYPALREAKGLLEQSGAFYASLSGSGSALYGLFGSRSTAQKAVAALKKAGIPAVVTTTLTRRQYWKAVFC